MSMNKEVLSLSEKDLKLLLEILGYKISENKNILDSEGNEVVCPFTKDKIQLDNLSIMPGSIVLMNTTPVTLSEYFYQYPDE